MKFFFTGILCIGLSMNLFGHGEVHERIVIATEEIMDDPDNPMQYIKRASLYLEDGDYDETIIDLEKAKQLGGEEYSPAMMTYAKMYHKMEANEAALKHINNFLSYEPDHVLGLLTKAKILKALEQHDQSAIYYKKVIEKTSTHLPENFIDLINVLMDDGQMAEAFEYYEAAQLKFGHLIVFDLKAIEIAKEMNDNQKVLEILDKIIESQQRKERWYCQKAEVLIEMENYELAEAQLQLAIESLKALPQRIKLTKAMQELSARITSNEETIKTPQNESKILQKPSME